MDTALEPSGGWHISGSDAVALADAALRERVSVANATLTSRRRVTVRSRWAVGFQGS